MMLGSYLQASARQGARIGGFVGTLLLAVLATAACGASSDVAWPGGTTPTPRSAALPPVPPSPQCPIGWNFCFTGYNNALVFVGPGQLASSVFQLSSQSARGNPFPQTWSGPDLVPSPVCPRELGGAEWCAQIAMPVGLEENYQAVYSQPFPPNTTETVTLSGDFSTWQTDTMSPGTSVACDGSTYTICTVVGYNPISQRMVQGGKVVPASAEVHLSNLPLIIKINNNLPPERNDSLVLDGTPEARGNLVLDTTNGGYPTTIDVGESGYFGGYLPTPAANSSPTFVANFKVNPGTSASPGSTDLQNWRFQISAQFTSDGKLDLSNSLCSPEPGQGTAKLYCDMAFEGGILPSPSASPSAPSSPTPSPSAMPQSGVQRLTLNIHE